MFVAVVSFLVNLATALLFFLVSIGDLTTGRFFTSFYILKVAYTTGDGPQSGLLNEPYNVLTFGLWNYCEGMDSVINACSDPEIGYTLDSIPSLNVVDQQYVSDAVRNFEKVTILYIPATCIAFVAFLISAIALTPRFRKRWLHAISAHLLVLATLSSILLLVVVFTVNGSRRIQFEEHVVPDTKVTLGPGVWITLALVPLTVFGSLFSAFAVCCPGRFERSRSTYAEEPKEGVYEPSL
ncbi:actin cortical patch SUR7/pH-response regulator pali [Dissophora ornata]|nr:actin cortical patch SUR7/pH-response regulator pali [Dissophora ornata]